QEGTPTELKRSVGSDVIVVELADKLHQAADIADALGGVDDVTIGRRGITISTANGAGLVADVAVAFSRQGISPQSLTVRTPSLDDVFLRATGHRLTSEID
ncbi:MAG TPA: daunorubicin ABC transporter ATP-binding protein, partial [Acidimicrobiaceae bacterium]|nr:daunorubicin ABC transporter ATP-binding protein [Acidimicrobiaceae bacterium]